MAGLLGTLNICTLNVRGLRRKKKRKNILFKLKKRGYDIIALQETHYTKRDEIFLRREWGDNYHFSAGTTRSKGLFTLFGKNIKKDKTEMIKTTDRMIISKVKVGEGHIYIVNVYGPCIDNEKPGFIKNLSKEITNLGENENIILLGDTNIVMNNELDIISGLPHDDNIVKEFNEAIIGNGLNDLWRQKHRRDKVFSWSMKTPFIARRLDYIFVSDNLSNYCKNIKIEEFGFSDHKIVEMRCDFSILPRGQSYYKFNTRLLNNPECVREIKKEIETAKTLGLDPHMTLEYIKIKIRTAGMEHGKKQSRQRNFEKNIIIKKMKEIEEKIGKKENNEEDNQLYSRLKQRWEIIEVNETEGARMRAGQKWIEEGEMCNKFFLNLEKQRAEDNNIYSLYNEKEERQINTNDEILQYIKEYYETIYNSKEKTSGIDIRDTANFLQKDDEEVFINECDAQKLNSEITEKEILEALKQTNNKSSPGLDGIPAEVYKFFWLDIKNVLLENFRYSFEKEKLGNTQKLGIICLIHKGKELSRDRISNWRPLTLSNADYKLLAKVLANRLGKCIDKCVNTDQNAFIKGRNISNMIREIEDTIQLSKLKKKQFIILSIDYEKAFDTLSVEAILKATDFFGLGDTFKKWIEIILKERKSCIKNNGYISSKFDMTRGVRQGCPISPLLFLLAIELFARNVREDKKIKGIKFHDTEDSKKIKQFADDTTLLLADIIDFREILSKIKDFTAFSGLRLNKNKSFAIQIGKIESKILSFEGIKFVENLKILGIIFSNKTSARDIPGNIDGKIEKLIKICDLWSKRQLSIAGKIIILKTYGLSLFTYLIRSIGISEEHLTYIERIFFRFIWKDKFDNKKACERVSREKIMKRLDKGGLNMINIREYQNSFYLEWAERYINENRASWKVAPDTYYYSVGRQLAFNSNVSDREFKGLNLIPCPFWRRVLTIWLKYKSKIDTNIQKNKIEFNMNTPLFNNNDIRFKGNLIFLPNCIKKNIHTIGDIYDEDKGGLLTYEEYQDIYGKEVNDIFEYNVLSNGLKQSKGTIINKTEDTIIKLGEVEVGKLGRKKIMKLVEESKKDTAITMNKWIQKYQLQEWEDRYWNLVTEATKEVKLRVLHWKIMHHIYPTGTMLAKMKIRTENTCPICGMLETIEHFFYECRELANFWGEIKKMVEILSDGKIKLNNKYAILGITRFKGIKRHRLNQINHIIILAKHNIAQVKYGNKTNYFINFEYLLNMRKLESAQVVAR